MLDLRLPVGIFFFLVGAILTVDGIVRPDHIAGVNLVLNRDWGIVLLVFGGVMTFFGTLGQRASDRAEVGEAKSD